MPKLTKKERDNIIAAIYKGKGKITLVAESLGVSRQTVYTYRDSYKSIANAIEDSRLTFDEGLLDIAEVKLRQALFDGEQWAIKYVLDKKGKSRGYIDAKNVDIGNADGKPFETKAHVIHGVEDATEIIQELHRLGVLDDSNPSTADDT